MSWLEAPRIDPSSPEMLARHDAKFARLLGADDPYGWDADGPAFWQSSRYIEGTTDAS